MPPRTPKKKPPVKKPAKKPIKVSGEDVVPHSIESYAWLRKVAELIYVTSQEAITIKNLAKLPEFEGRVHFNTIGEWCREDRWVEKRELYYNELQERIKEQILTSQVKSRVNQLQHMDGIFSDILHKLAKGEAEPGTYEGMVGAAVKVSKEMDELRDKISREIIPQRINQMLGSKEETPIEPEVSLEEARAGAMAIIEKRRQAAKKQAEEEKKKKKKKKKAPNG